MGEGGEGSCAFGPLCIVFDPSLYFSGSVLIVVVLPSLPLGYLNSHRALAIDGAFFYALLMYVAGLGQDIVGVVCCFP